MLNSKYNILMWNDDRYDYEVHFEMSSHFAHTHQNSLLNFFFVLSFSLYLDRGLTDPWLACSCNNFMYCTFAETAGFSRNSFFFLSGQLKENFSGSMCIVFVERYHRLNFNDRDIAKT